MVFLFRVTPSVVDMIVSFCIWFIIDTDILLLFFVIVMFLIIYIDVIAIMIMTYILSVSFLSLLL